MVQSNTHSYRSDVNHMLKFTVEPTPIEVIFKDTTPEGCLVGISECGPLRYSVECGIWILYGFNLEKP